MPWVAKTILTKNRDCYTRFQVILQNHTMKTAWSWHKNRHVNQWDQREDPNISTQNDSPNIQQTYQKYTLEERQNLQHVVLRKLNPRR